METEEPFNSNTSINLNKNDVIKPNNQKSTERIQQWSRSIPEERYFRLGTLRYGIKFLNAPTTALMEPFVETNHKDLSSLKSSKSNLDDGKGNECESIDFKDNCCCTSKPTTLDFMPWKNNGKRTKLPKSLMTTKNRTSTTIKSSSSSCISDSVAISTKTSINCSTATSSVEQNECRSLAAVRETSPLTCCYTSYLSVLPLSSSSSGSSNETIQKTNYYLPTQHSEKESITNNCNKKLNGNDGIVIENETSDKDDDGEDETSVLKHINLREKINHFEEKLNYSGTNYRKQRTKVISPNGSVDHQTFNNGETRLNDCRIRNGEIKNENIVEHRNTIDLSQKSLRTRINYFQRSTSADAVAVNVPVAQYPTEVKDNVDYKKFGKSRLKVPSSVKVTHHRYYQQKTHKSWNSGDDKSHCDRELAALRFSRWTYHNGNSRKSVQQPEDVNGSAPNQFGYVKSPLSNDITATENKTFDTIPSSYPFIKPKVCSETIVDTVITDGILYYLNNNNNNSNKLIDANNEKLKNFGSIELTGNRKIYNDQVTTKNIFNKYDLSFIDSSVGDVSPKYLNENNIKLSKTVFTDDKSIGLTEGKRIGNENFILNDVHQNSGELIKDICSVPVNDNNVDYNNEINGKVNDENDQFEFDEEYNKDLCGGVLNQSSSRVGDERIDDDVYCDVNKFINSEELFVFKNNNLNKTGNGPVVTKFVNETDKNVNDEEDDNDKDGGDGVRKIKNKHQQEFNKSDEERWYQQQHENQQQYGITTNIGTKCSANFLNIENFHKLPVTVILEEVEEEIETEENEIKEISSCGGDIKLNSYCENGENLLINNIDDDDDDSEPDYDIPNCDYSSDECINNDVVLTVNQQLDKTDNKEKFLKLDKKESGGGKTKENQPNNTNHSIDLGENCRNDSNTQTEMEKRKHSSSDRWQRLGFGRRATSNPPEDKRITCDRVKDVPRTSSTYSEKTLSLKVLTEKLKNSITSNQSISMPATPQPPPVPPPRRLKHSNSLDKSQDSDSVSLNDVKSDAITNTNEIKLMNNNKKSLNENLTNLKSTDNNTTTSIFDQPKGLARSLYRALKPNTSASNLENYFHFKNSDNCSSIDETTITTTATVKNNRQTNDSLKNNVVKDDDLYSLTKVESKSIIGSYTQKQIPFRSASFSQVDYSSGKYIRSTINALKASFKREKEPSVVDNANLTLPRKRSSRSNSPLNTIFPVDLNPTDDSIIWMDKEKNKTEQRIPLNGPIGQFDDLSCCGSIIMEEGEKDNIRPKANEMNVVQASLETLPEEEVLSIQTPEDSCLQTATTCLIPVPVYECVPRDWNPTKQEEQWLDATEMDTNEMLNDNAIPLNLDMIMEINENDNSSSIPDIIENINKKSNERDEPIITIDSIDFSGKRNSNADDIYGTPPENEIIPSISVTPGSLNNSFDNINKTSTETHNECTENIKHCENDDSCTVGEHQTGRVEVRKRHSNEVKPNFEQEQQGEETPKKNISGDERRRIDKSKRRNGIYIQWPAIDKVKEINNETWCCQTSECNKQSNDSDTDNLSCCKKSSQRRLEKMDKIGGLKLETGISLSDEENPKVTGELNTSGVFTPDSELMKPIWPTSSGTSTRRQSLSCQSSEEKDDGNTQTNSSALKTHKNILFLRSESASDNESDRTPSTPRDRCSQSPAPSDMDLKRYSKRPVRGPYGQMLEAEMKKTTKLHYDELLTELNRVDSANRNITDTKDDSLIRNRNNRKTGQLPIPSHVRAASTPAQMDLLDTTSQTIQNAYKRTPSNVETTTPVTAQSNNKKISLNSVLRDRSPKRASSEVPDKQLKRNTSKSGDKTQKRSLEEIRRLGFNQRSSSEQQIMDTSKMHLQTTPQILAELLKGSNERLASECYQMAQNGLPLAVIKCLDTRTHVVIELFNTEQSYVESLQTIVTKYLNPLKSNEHAGIIDVQMVDEIFFMVPAILNIHERFLDELKRRLDAWEPLQKVGDAFIEAFSKTTVLETYTLFVNNWNRAKNTIRSVSAARPAFAKFLSAMAREHKGKLALDNLLIKPVQKFPNYELILSRLIKHTDEDHPDHHPLSDAIKLVHDILLHLNCKEREALESGQRESSLRELEGVIEGVSDLVAIDRQFLLFDLVTMPSGQAARKERGIFLFNDILIITSIKRRSGTIRKPNSTCPGSVASTLDTNKYKFLMKVSLDEMEIVKTKDENLRKIIKEIESLNDDGNKLQQISEIVVTLKCQHQGLEDSVRELQRDLQKQLTERQQNETQLSLLEFTIQTPNNGIQNMAIQFSKPDKRTHWEEVFNDAKQRLATTMDRMPIPEFLTSIPIRKTRAGLQFTCASPTLSSQRDVWVCNSDGYVGQVCVLSLRPEPTVTSCNGVCNARILCVASIPAEETNCRADNLSLADTLSNPSGSSRVSRSSTVNSHSSCPNFDKKSIRKLDPNNIQLDSSSSEDSESEFKRASSPAMGNQQRDSNSDEVDVCSQSTMWLGTEDGSIHVYNCTDNIRIKKNKIKIQHVSAVFSILYLDNRVFVSLANGDICVYLRENGGWNTTSPLNLSLGTVTSPVTRLSNVNGKLWCAVQGVIKVLNTTTLQVENQIQISTESKPITHMAVANNFVWISIQHSAIIKCFHSTSYEQVLEVNMAPAVNKMLANCDDIIRQHKAACLRITSLLSCKELIWVGTSAGVLLTISSSNLGKLSSGNNSQQPIVTGIPYGHTGHVRFLTFVENDRTNEIFSRRNKRHSKNKSLEQSNTLIISGGDGYEDFRSAISNPLSEVAGREDSTNHLLLWHV